MNHKSTAYLITAAIAVIALIVMTSVNIKTKKNLKSEQLALKTLSVEKAAIEKELRNANVKFSGLQSEFDINTGRLKESAIKLDETEKRINSLVSENRSLRATGKELAELKKTKTALENEMAQLRSEQLSLRSKNVDLQANISSLEREKKDLEARLDMATLYRSDNFLATATGKKSEKLVIRASRAKKLNLAFEIPQNLSEDLSFKIVTPTGNVISPDDKNLSWRYQENEREFTASLSSATSEFEKSRRVVLNYSVKEKLAKGEYRIQIMSNGNNIGNCRMMVR
jgi:peptidoglycan hydrolase CwlO-like protein